jgi:hypothetical protein
MVCVFTSVVVSAHKLITDARVQAKPPGSSNTYAVRLFEDDDSMTPAASVLILCGCRCVHSSVIPAANTYRCYLQRPCAALLSMPSHKSCDLHSDQLRGRQRRCMQPRCSRLLAVVTSANPVLPSTSNCRQISFAITYTDLCSEQPPFRGASCSQHLVQS